MTRHTTTARLAALTATTLLGATALPAIAAGESDDSWQFRGTLYGYFPDIGGSASVPSGQGVDIGIDAHDLIRHTDFVFMGAIEAQKGRWGVLMDVIYLDLGSSVSDTQSVQVGGGMPLPPGITADASLDVNAWVWTLAGTWRALSTPRLDIDLLGGARLLDLEGTLDWDFSNDFGPFVGPGRAGSADAKVDGWDGIVGSEGRFSFGSNRAWFTRWYLDAGTGDSDRTWQAIAGIGRAFAWGEVVGAWRYLDYDFSSNEKLDDLDFNGPALGVAVRL